MSKYGMPKAKTTKPKWVGYVHIQVRQTPSPELLLRRKKRRSSAELASA